MKAKKGFRVRGLSSCLLALVLISVVCVAPMSAGAADEVKVGVILPLTGNMAPFGQASLNGLLLANELIQKEGVLGGTKITLISADCGSDPTTAASIARRMTSKDGVSAIIGAYASSLSLAVSEVTERSEVPFLTMSFTDLLTKRGFKYIFQVVPLASHMGKAQLTYTLEMAKASGVDIRKIAIVHEDTAYGSGQADGLAAEAKRLGIEVSLKDAYPAGLTDAMPLIQKIKKSQADVLFPISYFTDAVLLIRSMRQSGMDTPVVGGAAGFVIPEFPEALGDFTEGILSVDTSSYDHYGEIGKLYRDKHLKFMNHEAFEQALMLDVLARAVSKAKSSDPKKIAQALREIRVTSKIAQGLPGKVVAFDKTGLNASAYPVMIQYQKREMVTVWPASDALGKLVWKKK
ncbi:MAG: ABC transporter substrate-binding protein [Deltaproteobacteria bacterium]|nr:ABC transporter substrate-binding protein [Deltaproteobacteria bacterium]